MTTLDDLIHEVALNWGIFAGAFPIGDMPFEVVLGEGKEPVACLADLPAEALGEVVVHGVGDGIEEVRVVVAKVLDILREVGEGGSLQVGTVGTTADEAGVDGGSIGGRGVLELGRGDPVFDVPDGDGLASGGGGGIAGDRLPVGQDGVGLGELVGEEGRFESDVGTGEAVRGTIGKYCGGEYLGRFEVEIGEQGLDVTLGDVVKDEELDCAQLVLVRRRWGRLLLLLVSGVYWRDCCVVSRSVLLGCIMGRGTLSLPLRFCCILIHHITLPLGSPRRILACRCVIYWHIIILESVVVVFVL